MAQSKVHYTHNTVYINNKIIFKTKYVRNDPNHCYYYEDNTFCILTKQRLRSLGVFREGCFSLQ